MQFFKRSLIALGIAATLPTLVFASIQGFVSLRAGQEAVRAHARAQVREVNEFSQAELNADLRVLQTIVSSPPLVAGAWREYRPRGIRALDANPTWDALVVSDPRTGKVVLGLKRSPSGIVDAPEPLDEPALATQDFAVDGIHIDGDGKAHVYLNAAVIDDQGVRKYVLTVLKSPAVFQDILMRWAADSGTSALVDRSGRFIARTVSPQEKIGQFGSQSLRAAVVQGGDGEYRGSTLEGLQSYTAYETLPATGWSTHVAYKASLIDMPRGWSLAVAGLGAIGALALAGLLTTLVLRDMAERRRAEEALRHAQKMEAVGQLTGGIAHDFNNLLTPIIGGLERIRARLGADERTHKILENALEAARRAARLTSQLLAFSRSQRMQIMPVDLKTLLEGMKDLIGHSVGPDVRVTIEAPESALFVTSDKTQLELALLNMAVNARDAMPQGGALTMRSSLVTLAADEELAGGRYVDIAVTDSGTGMPEDVRVRATEPFFTTKAVGAGTGLGLSQVFALAHQSGGDVRIDSAPGRGTTVHVRLPHVASEAALRIDHPGNLAAPPPIFGDVLVVDDDAHVRAHIVDTLEAAGFTVTSVGSGEEALRLLDARTVDLLLVDFAMPGMNGAEVIRAARQRHKALKVLMVSGYSDSAAIEAAAGAVRVLRKPFDVAELTAAVTETIEA